jgi:plasmid stability protein
MSLCMRTTVRLPDDLMRAAKIHAAESGRTLTALIEDALRSELAGARAPAHVREVHLPTYGQGGVQPGIDLDDSASLLDAMEGSG